MKTVHRFILAVIVVAGHECGYRGPCCSMRSSLGSMIRSACWSDRAGKWKKVMASVQRFLEKRLRQFINPEKSAVGRPQEVHFLGFRFCRNK